MNRRDNQVDKFLVSRSFSLGEACRKVDRDEQEGGAIIAL